MRPSSKKTVPRKAKRVATIFTGTAAAAAAFVPAAQAGTVGQPLNMQAGTVKPLNTGGKIKPDYTIRGSIEAAPCSKVPQWLHLANKDGQFCFGYKGTVEYNGQFNTVSHECGGTNHGGLRSPEGTNWGFGPGTTWTKPGIYYLSSITINGWVTSTHRCGPL